MYVVDITDETFDNWYMCFNTAIAEGVYTIQNMEVCDIGEAELADLRSEYEYEIVQTNCKNGDKNIFGYCYKPVTEEKVPLLIFSHALGGTYKNVTAYAEALAANGYAVYAYDFCCNNAYYV